MAKYNKQDKIAELADIVRIAITILTLILIF
jgi:hypothetical protein